MILIRNTTIDRTNGCTLGLVVEAFTLCTFIRYDKIIFVGYRLLKFVTLYLLSVGKQYISF
jgi:hypothetical protein